MGHEYVEKMMVLYIFLSNVLIGNYVTLCYPQKPKGSFPVQFIYITQTKHIYFIPNINHLLSPMSDIRLPGPVSDIGPHITWIF